MIKVKICGITNYDDAYVSYYLGAAYIGFIFAESPRRVSPEKAKRIIELIPSSIEKVGVFVDEVIDEVNRIADYCGLDIVQLHGKEPPEYCSSVAGRVFKAFRIRKIEDIETISLYNVDGYLLDAFVPGRAGGTGKSFDWNIAVSAKNAACPLILSGGLGPGNIEEAIKVVHPEIVDAGSGVEVRAGIKDHKKIETFMERVYAAG